MKNKILLFIFGIIFSLCLINQPVFANNKNSVEVYMFVGNTCPHCRKLEQDIISYSQDKPEIKLHFYEVFSNSTNQDIMRQVAKKLNANASGVPFIIYGNNYNVGYSDNVKQELIKKIESCAKYNCPDQIGEIVKNGQEMKIENKKYPKPEMEKSLDENNISLPFGIKINTKKISLPFLTAIIGLLDGFNPCAMWALVFIITLLIGMDNKKKMWSYGLAFIATSAFIYLLFMAAWLNVFVFIGLITPVRIIIGLLAIGIGGYYLNEYRKKDTVCKVTNAPKRQKFFQKMKQNIEERGFWAGLIGVVILAIAVNMVELICSAGLPVVYTSVLSSSNLNNFQYVFYLLFYILFFMLDDLIVFGLAMKTMSIVNIDAKYSKISRLVGGILMLILGTLLIFAPNLIMFS